MNSGQALIACADFAVTLMFKVVEEVLQNIPGEIIDTKMVNGMSATGADPRKQNGEGVTIAALRVLGEVSLRDHMLQKKAPYPTAEQVRPRQGSPPVGRSARSKGSPL